MIKNNLEDLLKRQPSKPTSSNLPLNNVARVNKFKPALGGAPGRPQPAASGSSRMAAPAPAPARLPSFSSPGFNKPRNLSAKTPSVVEIAVEEYEASSQQPPESQTPSQSQTQSSSSSSMWQGTVASSQSPYITTASSSSGRGSARKKRYSSDLAPIEVSSPKRAKSTKEKENKSTRPSQSQSQDTRDKGKGKAAARFPSPISSQSSPRANRTRPPAAPSRDDDRPWDSFEIVDENPFSGLPRFPTCAASPVKKAPAPAPASTPASPPPKPPESDYLDLNDQSLDTLRTWLDWNMKAMKENFDKLSTYWGGDRMADRFVLEQFKRVLEERINGLEKLIREREIYERKLASSINPAPTLPPTAGPSVTLKHTLTPAPAPKYTPAPAPRYTPPFTARSPSPVNEVPTRPSTTIEEIVTPAVRRAFMPPPAPTPIPIAQKSHYFSNTTTIARSNDIIDTEEDSIIDDDDDDDDMWQAVGDELSEDAIEIVSVGGFCLAAMPPSTAAPYELEIVRVLRNTFGLESFRTNQREAITGTLQGKDVFVLMPTGGGKSLCYQLPAVCETGKTRGVTFVVSPLLALMHDQVGALEKKGVDVLLWNSERTQDDVKIIMQRLSMRGGGLPKVVYITPEKIKESALLRSKLKELYDGKQIARFVIDEAHCISSWGRDFRDAYQELHVLREEYPDVPIMALTATANRTVADDIRLRLRMRPTCISLTQSFNRPNLFYTILPKQTGKKGKGLEAMASFIKERHPRHSGVIYCFSRNDCEKVAMTLRNEHGLGAKHFHAGMDAAEKAATQAEWQSGRVAIIVATIAFGMGIDKADVRFVIHHSAPKSMDGYYQETGRAGRDGKPADCVLYYDYGDCKKLIQLIRSDRSRDRPSPANMKRQEDGVREVIEFCHNNTECRRSYVLRYFGETFSPADCKRSCDTCVNAQQNQLTTTDATKQAKTIIQLVETLSDGLETNVSEKQAMNCYTGANLKELRDKGLDRHPLFGAGKGQPKELVSRLFADLIVGNALELVSKENSAGWHTTYVTTGSKVQSFRSAKKIMVSYRPSGMAFTTTGRANSGSQ